MSGHHAGQVAIYLGSSTRKMQLAGFHLRAFRDELARVNREGGFSTQAGPADPFIAIDAHSDGCVVQLFGAFDAFSCAAAWHFRLEGPSPDRYSFVDLARRCPGDIGTEILRVLCGEYTDLREQRRVAVHRGILPEKRILSVDAVLRLETADGANVSELLERLFAWGEPAMRRLHAVTRQQAWPGHDRAYLLS